MAVGISEKSRRVILNTMYIDNKIERMQKGGILRNVPDAAGVYMMKESHGRVIYIGKAKSLKKRLNSYFGRDLSSKTVVMMSNVSDIEYRLTPTESMALLLEASLIHKYKPKYNVSLRDDKSFPMVKITNEEFPAICITRERQNDQARYFGPYTNAGLLREALKTIRRNFPYRSCRQLPREECIYYRIGLSPAPCIGKINKMAYAKTIKKISLILEGKTDALIKRLSREMALVSREQRYEEAAKIRDQINALSAIGQGQPVSSSLFELRDLKNLLKLQRLPVRIEAFDISDIFGKEATGSMVSFYRAVPDKNNYRRFRIKTVEGIDDYRMLSEVIHRRYLRLIEEELPVPNLILIDGGKNHLLSAEKELKKLGLQIPLASIAKQHEFIYTKDSVTPTKLRRDTPALNLIRRVRDEAHRFAVSYHHILRRKKIIGK
jgi:excinuclease ABC subunit C